MPFTNQELYSVRGSYVIEPRPRFSEREAPNAFSPGPGDLICLIGGTHKYRIGIYKHTKKYGKYAMVYVIRDWSDAGLPDLPGEDLLNNPLLKELALKTCYVHRKHIKKLPGREGEHPHPWHFRSHDNELERWIDTFCKRCDQQNVVAEELDLFVMDFIFWTFEELRPLLFSKQIVYEDNFMGMLTNRHCDHLHPEDIALVRMMCFRCLLTGKRWGTDLLTQIRQHGFAPADEEIHESR